MILIYETQITVTMNYLSIFPDCIIADIEYAQKTEKLRALHREGNRKLCNKPKKIYVYVTIIN